MPIGKGSLPWSILHTAKTSIYKQCDATDEEMEDKLRQCRVDYGRVENSREGVKMVIRVWRDS